MGAAYDPQVQRVIIEGVKESPLWIKIILACIPVVLAYILGRRKR